MFNVLRVHWKIQLLGGGSRKTNTEREDCLKMRGGLDSLSIEGGLGKKERGGVFFLVGGGFDTQCTLCSKLDIFTHFTFTNLPWCSQSMNSLIYVYSIQIPSWSQTWSRLSALLRPPKKFLYHPLMGLRFWPWNFLQQGQGFHSMKVREFMRQWPSG